MIRFANLWALLLLPLPLLIYILMPARKMQQAMAVKVPFFNVLPQKIVSQSEHSRARNFAYWLIWILLVASACKPELIGPPIETPEVGRNLMIAVDISGSMRITDMVKTNKTITRLSAVKQVAKKFVEARKGDRLGLIVFATKAYVYTPLTFDHRTVMDRLDDATIGLAGQQTALGDAIGLGIKRLVHYPAKNRVLIALTDGASNAGSVKPLEAARLAEKNHIKIYTIGIGSKSFKQRDYFGNIIKNPSLQLDEQTLKSIAQTTQGQYFRATDAIELRKIYERIDELEPVTQEKQVVSVAKSLFYVPLLFALLISFILWFNVIRPWQGMTEVEL